MVTAEDIGRTHPPLEAFQFACGECLNRVRSIARLVPDRTGREMIRDFAWMVPTFSLILGAVASGVSFVSAQGFDRLGLASRLIGGAAVLFGLMVTWDRTKYRYGFTHDLRWSLSSKRVDLSISIVVAGIVVESIVAFLILL